MISAERRKTENFLYKGHPLLGRLFTLPPLALFFCLSITFTTLLFVPASCLGIFRIDYVYSDSRSVGLFQRWNWSVMFPIILPALFAWIAIVSNKMRKSVENLFSADIDIIKARSTGAQDYLHEFSDRLASASRFLFPSAIAFAIVFSLIDASRIIHGSWEWFLVKPHLHPGDACYPFRPADMDWTVAFTFTDTRFGDKWFPLKNLAFDSLAYLIQGLAIFLGLFWVGKFWLFIRTFITMMATDDAPYEFEPMRRDLYRRLGLGGVGRLFNYFAAFLLIFQSYVFFHRLQLVAENEGNSKGWIGILQDIYEKSKNFQNPFTFKIVFGGFTKIENLGMWLLLVVTTVIILWTIKLMMDMRTYIEGRKEALWTQYRRDIKNARDEGAISEIISLESDMKELRESTAWINGDNTGPRFVVALLTVTIVAWLPPILAYAAPFGVLSYVFPPLKSTGETKA